MIVLDASAAIEVVLDRPSADAIDQDIRRAGSVLVPGHFEADAYAGLRRMVTTGVIQRERLSTALGLLAKMTGDRVSLAPLLPAAYRLYDRVGAHDSFYVALALERGATLLTSDAPLARAAEQVGANVIFRAPEARR